MTSSAIRAALFLLMLDLMWSPHVFADAIECDIHGIKEKHDKIPTSSFQVEYSGRDLIIPIGKLLNIHINDKTLQVMYESTQLLNKRILALIESYNACAINQEKYDKELASLLNYKDNANEIYGLIPEIEKLTKNQTNDKAALNELKEKMGKLQVSLKQYMDRAIDIKIKAFEEEKLKPFQDKTKEELEEERRKIRAELDARQEETKEQFGQLNDVVIPQIQKEMANLSDRVGELEKQIKYLMSLYTRGELDTTKLLLGTGLYSTYIKGELRPQLLINGEILYPAISKWVTGLAPLVEIGKVWWDENTTYTTLPGLPPKAINETQDFYFVDAGLKKYFNLRDSVDVYVGAVAGYSWQTKNEGAKGLSGNIVGGLSLYPGKYKTSLEVRYGKYPISEKQILFNPFGNADVSWKTTLTDAFSMGIVFQF